MKKAILAAAAALAIGASALPALTKASAENAAWSAVGENNSTATEEGVNFRAGGVYRYGSEIDLENNGFSVSMTVEGNFRREDSWFALTLASEYSSAIGEYRGLNVQFKPVSTQGAAAGSMPAYVSLYTLGTAEGGSSAAALATVNASDIPEREVPYVFHFSVFYEDGTFIINYGIDTFTYRWNTAGLDMTALKASLFFGGADAATTDMNVTVRSFGEAKSGDYLVHASSSAAQTEGMRIAESAKRQGKIFYPVPLSADKEIAVEFLINEAPGWYVNDRTDAWFGIFLTSSPNAALPGSATFATIIRAHEDMGNGIQHIGGAFFFNGTDKGGFSAGVNTKPAGEMNRFLYRIENGQITMTLEGATSRTQTVEIDAGAFPEGVAYLSFAFNDNQRANIVETNDLGEEIGRIPNPDVKYWDITLGKVAQFGAPSVLVDGCRVNTLGGERVRIPVRLYGGQIARLERRGLSGYEQIPVNEYAVRTVGDEATILFTEAFSERIGLGEHAFRLTTSHSAAAYNGLQTEFTVELVEAQPAQVACGAGTYSHSARNDVKYSFVLKDDAFVKLEGNSLKPSDYFYNPVTGNLYLKREYCKNLAEGEYEFAVQFEFTSATLRLVVEEGAAPAKHSDGQILLWCGIAAGVVLAAAGVGIAVIAVKKKKAKGETNREP